MAITEGQLEKRGKYYHWRYSVDGQRKKMSLKVTKLAEAKRLRQAYIAEYNEDPDSVARDHLNPSLKEFWSRYSAWSIDHKRPGTLEADSNARKSLVKVFGDCKIGAITHRNMEEFKSRLKNKGVLGGPP